MTFFPVVKIKCILGILISVFPYGPFRTLTKRISCGFRLIQILSGFNLSVGWVYQLGVS